MKIDIFAHIMPPEYVEHVLPKTSRATKAIAGTTPTLTDLEQRFAMMDQFPDVAQVLTLAGPIEPVPGLSSAEVARVTNDGLATLVSRYPQRFPAAVASLPLDDMDQALKEAERALSMPQFRGVEVFTPAHGRPLDGPDFEPLWAFMEKKDLPVWIHPRRELTPDYPVESRSKYRIFGMWGWPYETTVAMTRLVFSGVLDRYENLKFITHHCGAMIPYFEQRIATWYDYVARRQGADYGAALKKPPLDYFRMFYGDTALNGSTAALECGLAFFGNDHILFGTDAPFDAELGAASIEDTVRSIEELGCSKEQKASIFSGNARRLLKL